MMKEQEVLQMIQNDFKKFWERRYDNPKGIPYDLIGKFRLLLLHVPYTVIGKDGQPASGWGCSVTVARKIAAKQPEDLTFLEIGIVINLVIHNAMAMHFDILEQAFDYIEECEELKTDFNKRVDLCNQQLANKQQMMLKLSGHTNAANFNGKKN